MLRHAMASFMLVLAPCNGSGGPASDQGAPADATASDSALPACTWPADLNVPFGSGTGGVVTWQVARALVQCGTNGDVCLSNDTRCNNFSSETTCVDLCGENEYVVDVTPECPCNTPDGSPPPMVPVPPLGTQCHNPSSPVLGSPATFSCCACQ